MAFFLQEDWTDYYNESCSENITGPLGSWWVHKAFGQCIGNVRQWFAFWIGLSSILCWMMALIPQLVTNCRTGKADEALSVWFLMQWMMGDLTNLLGAVLTGQLFTQIATAVYFLMIDCVIVSQYFYYLIKNQGVQGLRSFFKDKPQVLAGLLPGVVCGLLLASQGPSLWTHSYQTPPRTGRILQQSREIDWEDIFDFDDAKSVAGYVLGCISAAFYVFAQIPQIIKNCRRCSVEGLSPILFILAMMGEITYCLGIFLYSVDPVFLLQRLPWIVGSGGALVFEFTIVVQFVVSWIAKCRRVKQVEEKEPLLAVRYNKYEETEHSDTEIFVDKTNRTVVLVLAKAILMAFFLQEDWTDYYNESCSENITGPLGSWWVHQAFGQCIGNVRQWFAFWIGLSSILCWMMALIPQLVTNCRTGKADQVLSVWFLMQWVIGDTTNLLGAILTDQLFTQLATAVYFVLIDCVSVSQYIYYIIKNQGLKGLRSCYKDKPTLLAGLLPGVVCGLLLASQGPSLWTHSYQTPPRTGRILQQSREIDWGDVINFADPRDVAGYVLGCISAAFYFFSRVPQIVKNFRRCSVDGLSPLLFTLAILGNVTYGLGIFLYSVDPVFLLQRLPWIVGSVGTLVFDFIIMGQFAVSWLARCRHDKQRDAEKEPLLTVRYHRTYKPLASEEHADEMKVDTKNDAFP
ncbi:uncharacterized protein LOC135333159 [Halichondria panicea]|uniref:uncharacterized protein LOC135333159 n=1 Tax=Halichondria panicea TaxID=6063 RepID=UPI00312B9E63